MRSITRRKLWAALVGVLPVFGQKKPKLASGVEILKSFDARDWARHFVEHQRANPAIALDEECMATWFANALMRGYDEHARNAWELKTPGGRVAFEVWNSDATKADQLAFFIGRRGRDEVFEVRCPASGLTDGQKSPVMALTEKLLA